MKLGDTETWYSIICEDGQRKTKYHQTWVWGGTMVAGELHRNYTLLKALSTATVSAKVTGTEGVEVDFYLPELNCYFGYHGYWVQVVWQGLHHIKSRVRSTCEDWFEKSNTGRVCRGSFVEVCVQMSMTATDKPLLFSYCGRKWSFSYNPWKLLTKQVGTKPPKNEPVTH